MKAEFTTNGRLAIEKCHELVEFAISQLPLKDENFGRHKEWCDGICTCGADYENLIISDTRVSMTWDHYYAEIGVEFPRKDTFIIFGDTCGGTHQAVKVNIHRGEVKLIHDGARRSSSGAILDLMADWFIDWIDQQEWEVAHIETSEPSWAVPCWALLKAVGEGPSTAQEADWEEAHELVRKWTAVGIELPEGLVSTRDDGHKGPCLDVHEIFTYQPKFEGFHFRRAAALGIKI